MAWERRIWAIVFGMVGGDPGNDRSCICNRSIALRRPTHFYRQRRLLRLVDWTPSIGSNGLALTPRRFAEKGILTWEDQREWVEERRRWRILKRKIAVEGALEREEEREKRRWGRLAQKRWVWRRWAGGGMARGRGVAGVWRGGGGGVEMKQWTIYIFINNNKR